MLVAKLKELKEALDSGLLTAEEYNQMRADVLQAHSQPAPAQPQALAPAHATVAPQPHLAPVPPTVLHATPANPPVFIQTLSPLEVAPPTHEPLPASFQPAQPQQQPIVISKPSWEQQSEITQVSPPFFPANNSRDQGRVQQQPPPVVESWARETESGHRGGVKVEDGNWGRDRDGPLTLGEDRGWEQNVGEGGSDRRRRPERQQRDRAAFQQRENPGQSHPRNRGSQSKTSKEDDIVIEMILEDAKSRRELGKTEESDFMEAVRGCQPQIRRIMLLNMIPEVRLAVANFSTNRRPGQQLKGINNLVGFWKGSKANTVLKEVEDRALSTFEQAAASLIVRNTVESGEREAQQNEGEKILEVAEAIPSTIRAEALIRCLPSYRQKGGMESKVRNWPSYLNSVAQRLPQVDRQEIISQFDIEHLRAYTMKKSAQGSSGQS